MTRKVMLWGAVLLVAAIGATAFGQAADKAEKMHVGKIVAVNQDRTEFTLQMGEAEQSHKVDLKVTPQTTFEVDGQTSTAAQALTVGAYARVRYAGDTATNVAVTTTKKGEEPKKDTDAAE